MQVPEEEKYLNTKKELEALLRILNDHGEEKLLHYIKYRYLKGETRKIKY